ncbi:MAG: DNA polymerase III subunit gamma/tau [Chlamydiota bacterium]
MDNKPDQYQVIARKYRPQTFESVVGQEAIVTTLKNALRFQRLAHAYLFCGCRGTGKTTLARLFAKALNCSNLSESLEPCNACSSCLGVIAGRSLDVLEIDGASNRGIDDIRQINETIGYAPASGKYKIYIIDEVHMLTKEAFNALLKTLEEPPPNVKFFFATTEPHKVLPTIVSRCQRFDLARIGTEALKEKLAAIANDLQIPCEEEVFSLIANLSDGSLRDAESLLDQILCYSEPPISATKVAATLGIMPKSAFFALDQAFEEQNLSYAFELANDVFASGKDYSYFLDTLIDHYRTLLKIKLGSPPSFFSHKQKEQTFASAQLYTEEQCLYLLDYLIQWQQQIGKTPFKRISIEMILLHIIRSKFRVSLPSLVKRLNALSTQAPTATLDTPVTSVPIETLHSSSIKEPVAAPVETLQEEPVPSPQSEAPAATPIETVQEEPAPSAQSEEPAAIPVETLQMTAPAPTETVQQEPAPSPQSEGFTAAPVETLQNEPTKSSSAEITSAMQSRYDTIVRFAAIELEGIIKKESVHG